VRDRADCHPKFGDQRQSPIDLIRNPALFSEGRKRYRDGFDFAEVQSWTTDAVRRGDLSRRGQL
jgi:hypothetical protein